MGQSDKYNLHRVMLKIVDGSTKATIFLALNIATKFSIHRGAEISSEISLVPLGVGTTVRLGFGVEF